MREINTDYNILFLDQISDIDITHLISATFTFQVRLTFTTADRVAVGMTLSDVTIYHDEDKSFEESKYQIITNTPSFTSESILQQQMFLLTLNLH